MSSSFSPIDSCDQIKDSVLLRSVVSSKDLRFSFLPLSENESYFRKLLSLNAEYALLP